MDAERLERLVARAPPLGALELAIEHDLNDGRHLDVVAELDALVAAEPLRERAHAQRMLALHRSGRQGDALAAHHQADAAPVDAIGVKPAAELRRLHEAILRQDPSLEPPAEEAPSRRRSSTRARRWRS